MTDNVLEFESKSRRRRAAQEAWENQIERERARNEVIGQAIIKLIERGQSNKEIVTTLLLFASELDEK